MIDQKVIDKYGLIEVNAHFGQAFMYNVRLYELPTENLVTVLISDGDYNGKPCKDGEYSLWIEKGNGAYKEIKDCTITRSMMMDVDKSILISVINNSI